MIEKSGENSYIAKVNVLKSSYGALECPGEDYSLIAEAVRNLLRALNRQRLGENLVLEESSGSSGSVSIGEGSER